MQWNTGSTPFFNRSRLPLHLIGWNATLRATKRSGSLEYPEADRFEEVRAGIGAKQN